MGCWKAVEETGYTSLLNQKSILALCHLKYRQLVLGRSRARDCPVWLSFAGTHQLPSQPTSSLGIWRPGSTHPAASTRGQCYIEEEEEEEEREEFRKHHRLKVLFPGMRTCVCKWLS